MRADDGCESKACLKGARRSDFMSTTATMSQPPLPPTDTLRSVSTRVSILGATASGWTKWNPVLARFNREPKWDSLSPRPYQSTRSLALRMVREFLKAICKIAKQQELGSASDPQTSAGEPVRL